MNRFDRQQRIAGWDQSRLREAAVAVSGRGPLATFLVWALASLGIGRVLWFGTPRRSPDPLADWLTAQPTPPDGTAVDAFPRDPEYLETVEWSCGEHPPAAFVECGAPAAARELCREYARVRGVPWFAGSDAHGGRVGGDDGRFRTTASGDTGESDSPIVAMAVAGLLADAVRAALCPLSSDLPAPVGCLQWGEFARPAERRTAVLVGAGGIGVYAATLLAIRGHGFLVVDDDRVEDSNRNRQGLFTRADAERNVNKAEAVRSRLKSFFPRTPILASSRRADANFPSVVRRVRPAPAAILSAVDNGTSRLILQNVGLETSTPVVQGGTDVFAADVFTQLPGRASLDDQSHAALSEAARRESSQRETERRRGSRGCAFEPSYVVPGMLAGAALVRRFEQVIAAGPASEPFAPVRWRQGTLPQETKDFSDELDEQFDGSGGRRGGPG